MTDLADGQRAGRKVMKGILGVGNLLMADEGFGIHVIKHIEDSCRLPADVELLDGGTAGMALMPFFQRCDAVLILDVINLDAEPGTLVSFSRSDFGDIVRGQKTSPHQIGILDILDILEMDGRAPRVDFLCAVPQEISESVELSPRLKGLVPKAAEQAVCWASGPEGGSCQG
jgi:hydrogenase maturation protease